MGDQKHTDTPWRTGRSMTGKPTVVISGERDAVVYTVCRNGRTIEEAEANTAFIVRACNSHEKLMDKGKRAQDWLRYFWITYLNSEDEERMQLLMRDMDELEEALKQGE